MRQEQLELNSPEISVLQMSLMNCRYRASSVGYELMQDGSGQEYDEGLKKHLLMHH